MSAARKEIATEPSRRAVPRETQAPPLSPPKEELSEYGKVRRRVLRGILFGAGAVGLSSLAYRFGLPLWQEREENTKRREELENRTLGPRSGEKADWWQELPEEQIRRLATIPEINTIGEGYVSAVSSLLQERAQRAGYTLIYQGNRNDTVGRTVVARGRQVDEKDWTVEDLGFGKAGLGVRGIFEAWIPDPKDPNQKERVYARLKNPITGTTWVVSIDLSQFDPNKRTNAEIPTFFGVDNLNYGPAYIKEKTEAAGRVGLFGYQVPDPEDPPSKKWKGFIDDFPEFYQMLRVEGYNLSDIVKPGDYVHVGLIAMGVVDGKNVARKDLRGVGVAGVFIVRRFGGLAQWQKETNTR